MVEGGRWSGRQQSDGYQSVCRCASEGYCWSRMSAGLNGYHLFGGSSGQLVNKEWGLADERIVSIDLEKSVRRISSWSAEGRGIKTSQSSTGIEGNLLMMEDNAEQYIRIGKLFYIYSILITCCA